MKRLLLIGLLALFPSLAQAQCNGIFQPNTVCGNNTGSPRTPFQINSSTTLTGPGTTVVGDVVLWNNTSGTLLSDPGWGLVGTSGRTYTFPTTSATVARTDAAQSFTGTQTFTGGITTTSNALATGGFEFFNTASANTGFTNSLQITNSGISSNSSTIAQLAAELSCTNCYTITQAQGGASPIGLVQSGAGLTGGLQLQSVSGPLVLVAGTTISLSSPLTSPLPSASGGTGANNSASTGFATWSGGVLGSVGASATVLPLANGGTGASTQSTAAINILPTPIANGDVIYWNGSAWVTLAGNNSGTQFLSENASGVPSWVTVSGTGTVTAITPGAGLVSSVATACSQANITTSGTLSQAHCINAQTGATYAIADSDRAKLITASNAGAQAYTIAQAGTASAFQAGWFTEIKNISATAAGVVTITPTTSTINGVATLVLLPGQTAKIVSDGTNYQVTAGVGTVFTSSLNSDVALNNTANYFDGPSVAQGTVGTWWASGTITALDTAATASFQCKLWDGTTVIASSQQNSTGANALANIALSGYLATPAGNIRISCKDISAATGVIKFNSSGNSKDSTVSVHRVQ